MTQAALLSFPERETLPHRSIHMSADRANQSHTQIETSFSRVVPFFDLKRCLDEQKDGLLITNGEGIGLWVNAAMHKVVGLTPEYFIGRPINRLFEEGIFRYPAVTERARSGKNELTDIQVVNNGNTVLVTSVPVMRERDKIQYMVTTVRNLAQLQKPSPEEEVGPFGRAEIDCVLHRLGIVYRSEAMRRVIDLVARVAATEATVLINGETGVGKELIARLLHELSPRRDKPFLRINCAALPRELAESELFGYEPGAFTGARSSGKVGLFEAAEGGTLLLDEIGEMSLDIQAKLLRVLQEREVLRVGATRAKRINVRVLATTNVDLRELINVGRFRPDLYHRLNVVSLEVPPLRARPEDIPMLLGHYLRLYCDQYRVRRVLAPETLKRLLAYSWPGNVRELANLMHRLVLLSDRIEITPHLLPEYMGGETPPGCLSRTFCLSDPKLGPFPHRSLQEIIAEVEKQVIELALTKAPSVREAARQLGISHSTLLGKIRKYSIQRP